MPDTRVAELLRSATDDLTPPTSTLVSAAITRGSSRRRRHLAGTALGVLAVIGLGAVAAPHVVPSASESNDFVAPPPAQGSAREAVVGDRKPIDPADGATTLGVLLARFGDVSNLEGLANDDVRVNGVRVGRVESADIRVVSRAVLNGGAVEAEVFAFHSEADQQKAKDLGVPLESANEACGFGDHTECSQLPDGSWFDYGTSGESEPGGPDYMQTKATLWTTDGFVVRLFAYNARPAGQASEEVIIAPGAVPVLTVDQLRTVATSPAWFQPK